MKDPEKSPDSTTLQVLPLSCIAMVRLCRSSKNRTSMGGFPEFTSYPSPPEIAFPFGRSPGFVGLPPLPLPFLGKYCLTPYLSRDTARWRSVEWWGLISEPFLFGSPYFYFANILFYYVGSGPDAETDDGAVFATSTWIDIPHPDPGSDSVSLGRTCL